MRRPFSVESALGFLVFGVVTVFAFRALAQVVKAEPMLALKCE